jgi:hypothetical protein
MDVGIVSFNLHLLEEAMKVRLMLMFLSGCSQALVFTGLASDIILSHILPLTLQ